MTSSLTFPRERSSSSSLLVIFAMVSLGYVLHVTNGSYTPKGIPPLMAAWGAMLLAFTWRRPLSFSLESIAVAGLCFQLYLMVGTPLIWGWKTVVGRGGLVSIQQGLMLVAVCAGLSLTEKSPLSKLWFPALVAVYFAMGLYILKLVPNPFIDVFSFSKEAIHELLNGRSPYGFQATNIYPKDTPYYPPSAVLGDKLTFGYAYLPLPLLISVPGALLGDLRYSMLASMSLAALLIGYARPGRLPKLAAALLLFTPKTFLILENAWTDPTIVLATAAVAFVAIRARSWVWLPAGFFLAMKQQMFIGIPALLLLVPKPRTVGNAVQFGLKAGGVALATMVFFIVWDPHGFARSALDLRELYRLDSVSLLAHLGQNGGVQLSKWTWALVLIPVAAFGYWRLPRTVFGFALFNAALHSTIYVFGTHGFSNEHFNVIGSLAVALAAWQPSNLES